MGDDKAALIIDSGSGFVKAGFAGNDAPKAVFPSVVGYAKNKESYVGDAAQTRRGALNIEHPIQHEVITDWFNMELIWQHMFDNELKVSSEGQSVLLSESSLNPKANREKTMRIMFENFEVSKAFIQIAPVLTLYASGRTTGVVVDSGYDVTQVVPIYEGYSMRHAINRTDIGGRDITEYLAKLLTGSLGSNNELNPNIVRNIKEEICYVANDYDKEVSLPSNRETYTLPDGSQFNYGTERFMAPEIMFQPKLLDLDCKGIHESVYDSILKCDVDLRKELYQSILLSGGNTLLPNFATRLQNEVATKVPARTKVNVVAPGERQYSAWIGGSVLASLPTFQEMWITSEEYAEFGSSIVHKKCL